MFFKKYDKFNIQIGKPAQQEIYDQSGGCLGS